MADTLKCSKCGSENPKSNKFCDSCGAKMIQKAPKAPEKQAAKVPVKDKADKTEKVIPAAKGEYVAPVSGAAPAGGIVINWEMVAWILIVIIALISRFAVLGVKPLHHDESMHAFYSWKLFKGLGYSYNPMMHGPFLFHANALIYFLFGATDYTARVMPAIYGMLCVGLIWFLRPYIGRLGAVLTAFFITVSPAFMYQSRYIRNDIYIAGDSLLMFIGLLLFFDTKKPKWLNWAAAGLALSWATKENTYITGFIFFTFFLAWWVLVELPMKKNDPERFKDEAKVEPSVAYTFKTPDGRKIFMWAFVIFFSIMAILYTTVFTYPKGLIDGFTKSLTYWLGQHGVERGSQPWYFYILITPFYEHLAVFFGLIASVFYLLKEERRTFFNVFLIYWWIMALIIYSWAGEKMPWLMLHPLTPLIILAGKFAADMIKNKHWGIWRQAGIVMLVLFSMTCIHGAVNVCFYGEGADPKESLVYVQTSKDVTKVVKRIEEVALQVKAEKWASADFRAYNMYDLEMSIEDYCSWPFAWYLREYKKIAYPPKNIPEGDKGKKTIILSGIEEASRGHDQRVKDLLGDDYVAMRYHLREWWAPDEKKWWNAPLKEKYSMMKKRILYRDVWNDLGAYDFVVYVRKDLEKYWRQ